MQSSNIKRIIFINRYFYPDHSATSQILSDLAFFLTSKNYAIEIITSRSLYDEPDVVLSKTDNVNNVTINRLWTSRFGRKNLLGRAFDYLSFYFSSIIFLLWHLKSQDVVVAKTDPPLISIIAAVITKFKRAKLINWTQDLFPEVADSLGIKSGKVIYPFLKSLRNHSLKSAYKNIVIGDIMSEILQREGVDRSKISVIHNWSIEDNIAPIEPTDNKLRKEWGLDGKFVVGYSGNMGRAHDYVTIFKTAMKLSDNHNIVFVIIGGGLLYDKFRKEVENYSLKNVIFKPYQSRENLHLSLTLPDVHAISLIPSLEGLIVPSKFYGIIAAGRPVIYIGSSQGEIPRILDETGSGKTVQIGQVNEMEEIIKELSSDQVKLRTMSENARNTFETKYTKKSAYDLWVELIESV